MIARSMGHYSLVRELGRGGMGVVYLATDTRLEREVALKVLSDDADAETAMRFLREAKLASAVAHPNIVTVYDAGDVDGVRYVAMEYVEGETLRARIRAGDLSVEASVRIARQVADALQAAQSRRIIHRDIKPENVMLMRDGHVKVLDFGIARRERETTAAVLRADAATETQITEADHVIGTTAYMSPEHLTARTMDTRADIFSLGVTLYEMLAGRLPFVAASRAELTDHILNSEPEALARFNYSVPTELEGIVRKCLQKNPARRYQTPLELSIDLANLLQDTVSGRNSRQQTASRFFTNGTRSFARSLSFARFLWAALLLAAVAAGAGYWFHRQSGRAFESMAVLPFANVTGDASLDYVAEGLGDEVINDLSRVPELRVTSRAAAQRYRSNTPDPQTAGRALGVKAVLTGRVSRMSERLRVGVELIDVSNGALLFGQTYERALGDLAGLQESLSEDVASGLRLALGANAKKDLARQYSMNSESYQLYLKGRYRLNQRSMQDVDAAVRLFEQSAEKDATFALAQAGLAEAYRVIADRGYQSPAAVLGKARSAAERALELDPNLSEARVSLAISRTLTSFDWSAAERQFRRAIELNPRNVEAHFWYAITLLTPLKRTEEALIEIQRAIELDPKSITANMGEGLILYFARRNQQAIEKFQAVDRLAPGFAFARLHLALTYSLAGRESDAVTILQDPALVASLPAEAKCLLAVAYAGMSRREEARRMAGELAAESARSFVSPYGRALVEVALGREDAALGLLERSFEMREPDIIYLNVDPKLDRVRASKKFRELLASENIPVDYR